MRRIYLCEAATPALQSKALTELPYCVQSFTGTTGTSYCSGASKKTEEYVPDLPYLPFIILESIF